MMKLMHLVPLLEDLEVWLALIADDQWLIDHTQNIFEKLVKEKLGSHQTSCDLWMFRILFALEALGMEWTLQVIYRLMIGVIVSVSATTLLQCKHHT